MTNPALIWPVTEAVTFMAPPAFGDAPLLGHPAIGLTG
jgi:hypothetical protein